MSFPFIFQISFQYNKKNGTEGNVRGLCVTVFVLFQLCVNKIHIELVANLLNGIMRFVHKLWCAAHAVHKAVLVRIKRKENMIISNKQYARLRAKGMEIINAKTKENLCVLCRQDRKESRWRWARIYWSTFLAFRDLNIFQC